MTRFDNVKGNFTNLHEKCHENEKPEMFRYSHLVPAALRTGKFNLEVSKIDLAQILNYTEFRFFFPPLYQVAQKFDYIFL